MFDDGLHGYSEQRPVRADAIAEVDSVDVHVLATDVLHSETVSERSQRDGEVLGRERWLGTAAGHLEQRLVELPVLLQPVINPLPRRSDDMGRVRGTRALAAATTWGEYAALARSASVTK